MLTFNYLDIKNFMSIGHILYEFTDGITLLLGANKDSAAADDNGAGKSSIAEALRWVLYGETVRNAIDKSLTVQHVIRKGADKAEVTLHFETPLGAQAVVTRYRDRKTSDLMINVGGTKLSGRAAREALDSILKINVIQFSNLVHLDGSYPKLFAPSTDAERKEILGDLVTMPVWEAVQGVVSARLAEVTNELAGWERSYQNYAFRRDNAKQQILRSREEGKTANKKYQELSRKLKETERELKGVEKTIGQLTKQEEDLAEVVADATKEMNDALAKKQDDILTVATQLSDVQTNFLAKEKAQAESLLNSSIQEHNYCRKRIAEIIKLQSLGKCTVCGQDTTEAKTVDLEELMEESRRRVDAIQQHEATVQEITEARDDKLLVLRTKKDTLIRERDALQKEAAKRVGQTDEEKALEGVREALTEARAKELQLYKSVAQLQAATAAAKKDVVRLKEDWDKAKTTLKEVTEAIEKGEAASKELLKQKEGFEFWKKGFGPKGVPSLLIETILPHISARIQKYADILTGGDVLVSLKAYTETQSKTIKEAIQISAVNTKGASVYGSNSAGERNRINLAVTLGLIDYFRSVQVFESSLLICDEIFDGLDSTGVEAALHALQAAAIPSIMVVSHHEHFKPLFQNTRYIEKHNGVSSLRS